MSAADPTPGSKAGRPRIRPVPLVRVWTIALIALVLIVALVMLFPGREPLKLRQQGLYDTASLSYLQTLLHIEPRNDDLRLALAGQLIARNRLDEAQQVLSGLGTAGGTRSRLLQLRLAMARYGALDEVNPERALARVRVKALMRRLQGLPAGDLSDAQMLEVAKGALAFGLPADAAAWYEALALRHPQAGDVWWAQSARWWLAAGRPERAAKAWLQAMQGAGTDSARLHAAHEALKTARMQGAASALAMATRLLKQYPHDPVLLGMAVDVARAANAQARALAWARRLVSLQPDKVDARRRLGQTALAAGDLDTALQAYRWLAGHTPDDPAVQEQLALLYIWTGKPDQALAYFRQRARRHPGPQIDARLLKLALAAHDYPTVVKVMLRQHARQPLSAKAMQELVGYMDEQLGQPRQAIALLRGWLDGAPAKRPLWQRLATLYVRTGQRPAAVRTWRHLLAAYGYTSGRVMKVAALETEAWHFQAALDALLALLAHAHKPPADIAYWQAMGSLANELSDLAHVSLAYGWLLTHHPEVLTPAQTGQLVTAWLQQGKPVHAVEVLERSWSRHPLPLSLMEALGQVLDDGRMDLARRLLALADRHPGVFAGNAQYWELRARMAALALQPEPARKYFLLSLRINPDNPGARAGLLSLLMDQDDAGALRHYLALWREDARRDPGMWEIYALAWSRLGKPRRAMPWFALRAASRPHDYLWLLSYADALDADRRFDAASRMRLHALTRLRPALLREMQQRPADMAARQRAARVLGAQQTRLGGTANLAWLQRVLEASPDRAPDQLDLELMLDWHLAEAEPAWARYWLLRARMRRLRLPVYQQLAVALAHNDVPRIGALLEQGRAGAEADQVEALQRSGQDGAALRLALNHIKPDQPWSGGIGALPRQAAGLYQKMPRHAGLDWTATRLGDMTVQSRAAELTASRADWTATVRLRKTRFDARGGTPALAGLDREQSGELAVSHHGPRASVRLDLGRIEAPDQGGFNHAGLEAGYQWTRRLHLGVFARRHAQSMDSGPFRRLGMRNSQGINLDYLANARDSLSLDAAALDWRSRWNEKLGKGLQLETSINHNLAVGQTWQLAAYANASYMHNDLVASLPAQLAALVPPGTDMQALLPRRFGFAGVGMRMSRGQPGDEYPTVTGLRFALDVGVGYVWPERRPTLHFRGSMAHRVFGGDALSLYFNYDRTRTLTGGDSLGVGLNYRWFFGK